MMSDNFLATRKAREEDEARLRSVGIQHCSDGEKRER